MTMKKNCYYDYPMGSTIKHSLVGIHVICSFQTRSLNIIETFTNLYSPLDCSEQDYVGFQIPVFIAKKYQINA